MTNSSGGGAGPAVDARPGKRERLIAAARTMLYERGIERTTLADIARAADVPAGNVYYYFKTKGELVGTVIERYQARYDEAITSLSRRRTPKARLRGMVEFWMSQSEILTAHGCPIGTLSTELDKGDDDLVRESARILLALLDWIEAQFRELGRRDARELAVTMLSAYEGVSVLANTLRDQELITTVCRRLERWIDSVA